MNSDNEQLKALNEQLKALMERYLGEAENTAISMRMVTEEKQQLQMKLDAVCRHRDELEKNRDLHVELNEELREQNESLQEELEEALNHISDLEDDNDDIDSELADAQNEVEELEDRCDDLENENANLQDYLEESENRIAELEELVHNKTSDLKQKGWIDPFEAMIISRKIDNLYNTIHRL